MSYAVEMGWGAIMDTKFYEDWFANSEVNKGRFTVTKQHEDRIETAWAYFHSDALNIRKVG
jgi:hypothetical protein